MSGLVPERRDSKGMFFYDPFSHLDDLFDGMFGSKEIDLFRNMKTDITEFESHYLAEIELPGFKKENIDISLNDNDLVVTAKRENLRKSKEFEGACVHIERSTGSFSRCFRLVGVDKAKISADYTDGILSITLPKEEAKEPIPKKINIG